MFGVADSGANPAPTGESQALDVAFGDDPATAQDGNAIGGLLDLAENV